MWCFRDFCLQVEAGRVPSLRLKVFSLEKGEGAADDNKHVDGGGDDDNGATWG